MKNNMSELKLQMEQAISKYGNTAGKAIAIEKIRRDIIEFYHLNRDLTPEEAKEHGLLSDFYKEMKDAQYA